MPHPHHHNPTLLHTPKKQEAVLEAEIMTMSELASVSTHEQPQPPHSDDPGPPWSPQRRQEKLLRKEVIQPHLPVRLPCYDFVPIASPTFDGSLHKGWATGFGCCRLS